jgi:hypothetical protein
MESAMCIRQWTLRKEAETFIFRCRAGGEGALLAEIADQVSSGALTLGEADRAILLCGIAESIPVGQSGVTAMTSMDTALGQRR